MSPIVLILVAILILALLGGGYGFRRGNNVLAGGGGLIGLILVILLVLFLMGHIQVLLPSRPGAQAPTSDSGRLRVRPAPPPFARIPGLRQLPGSGPRLEVNQSC